jgi:hypothetical protein
MFKQIGICVCVLLCAFKLQGMNVDSTYRHTISSGLFWSGFSPSVLYDFPANQRLISYSPSYGLGINYSRFKQMTYRKSIGVAAYYSNAITSYLYFNDSLKIEAYLGKINIQMLAVSPEYKYYAFKWVNLRLGLPISYLLSDKFENKDIAKRIGWYSEDGKSNFKRLSVSYLVGIDFNIRERYGVSFVFINGISTQYNLKTTENGSEYVFKEKFNSGYISLNYRLR